MGWIYPERKKGGQIFFSIIIQIIVFYTKITHEFYKLNNLRTSTSTASIISGVQN